MQLSRAYAGDRFESAPGRRPTQAVGNLPESDATMSTFREVVEGVGFAIDGVGVLAIVVGLAVATLRYAAGGLRKPNGYRQFRQDLGRGILLGLEFLVAADIIRTVAVTPTMQGVLILGMIVLIRTFLSMSLQVELEGRWPWQPTEQSTSSAETEESRMGPQSR